MTHHPTSVWGAPGAARGRGRAPAAGGPGTPSSSTACAPAGDASASGAAGGGSRDDDGGGSEEDQLVHAHTWVPPLLDTLLQTATGAHKRMTEELAARERDREAGIPLYPVLSEAEEDELWGAAEAVSAVDCKQLERFCSHRPPPHQRHAHMHTCTIARMPT